MFRSVVTAVALLIALAAPAANAQPAVPRLDAALAARAGSGQGVSRVIIRTVDGRRVEALIRSLRGTPGASLPLVGAQVATIPDRQLTTLAASPLVRGVSLDRPVSGTIERTAAAVGAEFARGHFGVDGTGVGVAIIDSGVTTWHDDLGADRVVHFADFIGEQPVPYDDYGHGTHVAGIIAGSGYDSGGARRGVAPGARLVVLKALDGAGEGYISSVIAALDYAIAHQAKFNIRVINLSVASGVFESFTTDPLALAAKRAVDAGIVVVTAAGNFGRGPKGQRLHGGITSPGNAPWVLTVGAGNHNGTTRRADDTVAPFSSRGPTHIDRAMKPDLVAPGVGIESLADSGSALYRAHPAARLWGTVDTATPPYLSMSGTSMAAPVVTGAVALMLEANPRLTPNLVKAILQYTAEDRGAYDHFAEGAGALNVRGAVQLARELAGVATSGPADPTRWSRHFFWGRDRIVGGTLRADANAWRTGVVWGADTAPDGSEIVWGTAENEFAEAIAWTAPVAAAAQDAFLRAAAVRGAACDVSDCGTTVWGAPARVPWTSGQRVIR